MKRLILLTGFIMACFTLSAQNVKKDATGNYVSIQKGRGGTSAKLTGQTYTDSKGTVYPVYVSVNGKLFVIRTSKAGNKYNFYLKLD